MTYFLESDTPPLSLCGNQKGKCKNTSRPVKASRNLVVITEIYLSRVVSQYVVANDVVVLHQSREGHLLKAFIC